MTKKASIGTNEMIYIAIGLFALVIIILLLTGALKNSEEAQNCATFSGSMGTCEAEGDCKTSLGKAGCDNDEVCCLVKNSGQENDEPE